MARRIETHLADCLRMPWDRVHEEAELLEHFLSEERIAARLGDPTTHGDPIPSRDGHIDEAITRDLSSLGPGEARIFIRASDADAEPVMLRHQIGLKLARAMRVAERR